MTLPLHYRLALSGIFLCNQLLFAGSTCARFFDAYCGPRKWLMAEGFLISVGTVDFHGASSLPSIYICMIEFSSRPQ